MSTDHKTTIDFLPEYAFNLITTSVHLSAKNAWEQKWITVYLWSDKMLDELKMFLIARPVSRSDFYYLYNKAFSEQSMSIFILLSSLFKKKQKKKKQAQYFWEP